jgi:hypothetical protein
MKFLGSGWRALKGAFEMGRDHIDNISFSFPLNAELISETTTTISSDDITSFKPANTRPIGVAGGQDHTIAILFGICDFHSVSDALWIELNGSSLKNWFQSDLGYNNVWAWA